VNPGFFAGIERVIDGFFDGGEQGFSWVIEAEQVLVLGEELADGDFHPLFLFVILPYPLRRIGVCVIRTVVILS
jgi:hypothetical protein